MQGRSYFLIVGLFVFTVCITSCSKKALQEEEEKKTAVLSVHPQWDEYVMCQILNTHLFQAETTPVHLETASSEYKISVEPGSYSIISHNMNVAGLHFTDLDSYHQAKATAIRKDQTKTEAKELSPVGSAYRLAVESVTLAAAEELHLYPAVHSLTKTLVFQFEVRNGGGFHRINGALEGVYHAVYLATGLPVGEETDWKIPFEIEINEENTATAVIHLLGIYDPDDGLNYENTLSVVLEDDQGETYAKEIDLSEILSDLLEENGGEIPVDIPVEIEVTLEVIDGNLVAIVKPWDEGKGGGEI